MANYNKYSTQNFLDFILTCSGSIENIFDIMGQLNYTSYNDFIPETAYVDLTITDNIVSDYNNINNNVISSILPQNLSGNIVCNGDLRPKTLVVGDYNNDYNDDFDTTRLIDLIVGYSGMDLYLLWSVTNDGNQAITYNGVLVVTGHSNRTISQSIEPGETYNFQEIYTSLVANTYAVILTGDCVQSISVEVLGSANMVCNDDFVIDDTTPNANETVTLTWSITNTGDAAGLYTGQFEYTGTILGGGFISNNIHEIIKYNITIVAGGTHTFSEQVTVREGNYTFISSCKDRINTLVSPAVLIPIMTYNSDLAIVPTPTNDEDTITVTWSITNTGTASGYPNGYIEYYPDDNLNKKSWNTTPTLLDPSQTRTFTKQYKVYVGDRQIRLTGDAIDTLMFSVNTTGVSKYVFWAQKTSGIATRPVFSSREITKRQINSIYFYVYIINSSASPQTVNIKLQDYSYDTTTKIEFWNKDKLVPVSIDFDNGTYISGIENNSNILNKHKVSLYIDNVFKGDIYYNVTL